ncbi:hypothetical protein [Streptomyces thermodiastaticus]|jgi:hypothetical protein|uniref:hypothetical protein n=1 Tax=Streptomyces thermodiastaticus TaxID=44061 RepID=UPI001679D659|nr:hypothetical protein [Streptomyces thermodiastaticus]MCE7549625.1 hypothetical protein [Streptomyces thermodiastaticus]GHF56681.1 hypothetical protein GCM10018787_00880 [Streptomyces thermodiastaticus]
MGNTQPHLRPGPVAAAAALALGIAVGPAAAEPGIFVSADGSTVSVTTAVCPELGGFWGTAALLSAGQTSVAEGRRAELTGSAAIQSAVWQDVRPGTYTVIVVCADNVTAGTQSVTVAAAARPSASASPASAASAASARSRAGGRTEAAGDDRSVALAAGGAVVGAAMIGTGWCLRRRSMRPYRL